MFVNLSAPAPWRAEAADAAELGSRFQDPGGHAGAGSDPQVMGIARPFDKRVFGQCRGVGFDLLESGIAQRPHSVPVDALHQEDLELAAGAREPVGFL